MDPDLAWPVSITVMASMLGFYLALRLGWSRRFKDPSLTVPQMINASIDATVARADIALYTAKAAGRNRTLMHHGAA